MKVTTDPTRFSRRTIWSLAWPMMLANISVPLMGAVDAAVMGHQEDPRYLGAVAVGASLFTVVYWIFGFLRLGTSGIAAQLCGHSEDLTRRHELRYTLLRSLGLGLLIGLALLATQPAVVGFGVRLMGASQQVTEQALEYGYARIFGAPAVLASYALCGWLIGIGRTRPILLMTLFANALNVLLCLLFVYALGMKSAGVAAATATAESAGLALGLWLVRRDLNARIGIDWQAVFDLRRIRQLVAVSLPLLANTASVMFVFYFFTLQGARLGDTTLAANAILMQLFFIMAYVLDPFSYACESLCGRCIGARDGANFHRAVRAAASCITMAGTCFAVGYYLLQDLLIPLLSSLPDVIGRAKELVIWLSILPFAYMTNNLLDGVFVGALKVKQQRNAVLVSTLLVFLPVWYLTRAWGADGLWLAFTLFFLSRSAIELGYYWFFTRSDTWYPQPLEIVT
ncbi:MAG: MATE family efflux transporter [Spongiibacteraceae bacterium]